MAPPTDWWERLYRSSDVAKLPWYTEDLDPDIATALEALGKARARVLDLGTGPGTQAVELARRGHDVVATDISASAIAGGKALARKRKVTVDFRVDDILETRLPAAFVDIVVDRGAFHVLPPRSRKRYASAVHRILRPGGRLLLKAFSDQEPGSEGPYRISSAELRASFREGFSVELIKETVFQGTLDRAPKAIFAQLRRL